MLEYGKTSEPEHSEQDPEAFIADGGWNFLDQDGGSDDGADDDDEEVIPDSIVPFHDFGNVEMISIMYHWCYISIISYILPTLWEHRGIGMQAQRL